MINGPVFGKKWGEERLTGSAIVGTDAAVTDGDTLAKNPSQALYQQIVSALGICKIPYPCRWAAFKPSQWAFKNVFSFLSAALFLPNVLESLSDIKMEQSPQKKTAKECQASWRGGPRSVNSTNQNGEMIPKFLSFGCWIFEGGLRGIIYRVSKN